MRATALVLVTQMVTIAANVRAQECAAGPADQEYELTRDTIPLMLDSAFPIVVSVVEDLGYRLKSTDAERGLVLTEPTARLPNTGLMAAYRHFDPPPIQLGIALNATSDSTRTIVTVGSRALCHVPGEPPVGSIVTVETAFEVAASAELSNALWASNPELSVGDSESGPGRFEPPQRLSCPTPVLPEDVIALMGDIPVEVAFTVTEDGRADRGSVRVPADLPLPARDAVMEAVMACRFRPARADGDPVRAAVTMQVFFRRR